MWSQRRFPRLRSTFAQALFLQRLAPHASWSDEVVRDRAAYDHDGSPEWLSGACLLLRRAAVDAVGGLDDGFFLYSEETDLLRRMRAAGWGTRYVAAASASHIGGASAPRDTTKRIWAQSRVRYARKHHGPLVAVLEAVGVALGALTHAAVWWFTAARRARPCDRRPRRPPRTSDLNGLMDTLTYAIITPARNERENLTRLAESVTAQRVLPACWVIVDDGSDDGMEIVAARARGTPRLDPGRRDGRGRRRPRRGPAPRTRSARVPARTALAPRARRRLREGRRRHVVRARLLRAAARALRGRSAAGDRGRVLLRARGRALGADEGGRLPSARRLARVSLGARSRSSRSWSPSWAGTASTR